MKQLASGVTVEVAAKALAGLTQCDLSLSTVFATSQTKEDKNPKDDAERVDWEVSVQGEFGRETADNMTAGDVKNNIKQGTKAEVVYKIGEMASYKGVALVTSYTETKPVDGKITYSATFKGSSKLEKVAVEPEPEPETVEEE